MNYQDTLKYLYESVPMFQQVGGQAYKPGIDTTLQLDQYFGHPHRSFKTIHIAGTNGKGSCSHTIAAVLQAAGYRVGLFTSPHLIDFRERIRINGEMIPESYVVDFVDQHRSFFEPLHPSFFELTTAMAFRYFADEQVEIAVVEVGMGGRLDCTNIIQPDLCVITNISFDHMQYLGDTLEKIAGEKAGIIKERVPVVIGRATDEVKHVFDTKAAEMHAPIHYAEELTASTQMEWIPDSERGKETIRIVNTMFPDGLFTELSGSCQFENCRTILTALHILTELGYRIRKEDYLKGFAQVCELTGLMGRWQKVHSTPDIICDTGHNEDGIRLICERLESIHRQSNRALHIVFGMVSDKDISLVLPLLPKHATYYFTKASVKRALPEEDLLALARKAGLDGTTYPNVTAAVEAAKKNCLPKDLIFVGGSSFIVADLFTQIQAKKCL